MATKVDKSNLLSESWQNVYDLINDSDNVTNPAGVKKWVYSRDPGTKAIGFKSLPYIVVFPAVVDFGERSTVNRQLRTVNFSVQVEVVSSDGMNQKGKGQEWNDSICDDILQLFNKNTTRNTLATNGLFFSTPNVSSVVIDEVNQLRVFRRSMFIGFTCKKKVF